MSSLFPAIEQHPETACRWLWFPFPIKPHEVTLEASPSRVKNNHLLFSSSSWEGEAHFLFFSHGVFFAAPLPLRFPSRWRSHMDTLILTPSSLCSLFILQSMASVATAIRFLSSSIFRGRKMLAKHLLPTPTSGSSFIKEGALRGGEMVSVNLEFINS